MQRFESFQHAMDFFASQNTILLSLKPEDDAAAVAKPPLRRAAGAADATMPASPVCKAYLKTGRCQRAAKCKFQHIEAESSQTQKGIQRHVCQGCGADAAKGCSNKSCWQCCMKTGSCVRQDHREAEEKFILQVGQEFKQCKFCRQQASLHCGRDACGKCCGEQCEICDHHKTKKSKGRPKGSSSNAPPKEPTGAPPEEVKPEDLPPLVRRRGREGHDKGLHSDAEVDRRRRPRSRSSHHS